MKLKQNSYLFLSIFKKFFPAPPLLPSSTSIATCGETTAPMSPSGDPRGAEARLSPRAEPASGRAVARAQAFRALRALRGSCPRARLQPPRASRAGGQRAARPGLCPPPRRISLQVPLAADNAPRSTRPGLAHPPLRARNDGVQDAWLAPKTSAGAAPGAPRATLGLTPDWVSSGFPIGSTPPSPRSPSPTGTKLKKIGEPFPSSELSPSSPQPRTPLPRAFQDRPPRREFG